MSNRAVSLAGVASSLSCCCVGQPNGHGERVPVLLSLAGMNHHVNDRWNSCCCCCCCRCVAPPASVSWTERSSPAALADRAAMLISSTNRIGKRDWIPPACSEACTRSPLRRPMTLISKALCFQTRRRSLSLPHSTFVHGGGRNLSRYIFSSTGYILRYSKDLFVHFYRNCQSVISVGPKRHVRRQMLVRAHRDWTRCRRGSSAFRTRSVALLEGPLHTHAKRHHSPDWL